MPAKTKMKQELTLKIILETPPAGVDFGIQKGAGDYYETLQRQRSDGQDLHFLFTVDVINADDSLPDFRGIFTQGKRGERFVYIDIGMYAGQLDSIWGRRLKIPLQGITLEMINATIADPKGFLVAKVTGTGKDGGPNCGTVKPFSGWRVGV
jgi:Family of unknown function (DUF5990)